MFSVVNVYHDHLKLCAVCIDGRRYVYCSECYIVSNECNEPTSCLVQPIGTHNGKVMYFGCAYFRGELVSTSPAFMRSSASHPTGSHGRLAPKTRNRTHIRGGGGVNTMCTAVATPL